MREPRHPVELSAPDIAPYRRGNVGVPYVTSFDSRRAGPHLMIVALTHGNELCGAIALDFLLRARVRPRRGKLTLAFANVAAYERFDPKRPTASRFIEEDLNRLWDPEVLDNGRTTVERARARELRPVIDRADILFDIHSMQDRCPPLMLCGPADKGRELACALGYPGHVVADAGHEAGLRLRDYGGFCDPASPKNALLIECGQHWERASAEVAVGAAVRLLHHLEMVAPDFARDRLPGARPQAVLDVTEVVTVRTPGFRFTESYRSMQSVPRKGTLIATDGKRKIRTPHDDCVLVMPSRRLAPGQTAVRLAQARGREQMADAAD